MFLLGLERAPCHAMYHDVFESLDVEAAARVLGDWVRGCDALWHVALDGKRLWGSAPAGHDGSAGVHLVAAFASRLGGVVGQLQVQPDGNEITAALALLKGRPLQGTIITGDAAFCQRAIRDRQGDYLFAIKAKSYRCRRERHSLNGPGRRPEGRCRPEGFSCILVRYENPKKPNLYDAPVTEANFDSVFSGPRVGGL